MIDGKNDFNQPINNDFETYENIRKVATGKGDDYTIGCLLDCLYFKENYKMIAIELSKQQALDAGPRAIQQINFTANTVGHLKVAPFALNIAMFFKEWVMVNKSWHPLQTCSSNLNQIYLKNQ